MPYIQVEPNVNLFVEDWGTGKPIVFIHGWPLTYKCFEYQMIELPKHGFRCIGIDLRGFGKSDKPWADYNYDLFADDIHQVLMSLDLHDVTLVGHSMGGAISLRYLARHKSDKVSKVAFLGAAAPSFTPQPGNTYGFTKEVCNQLIELCESDRAQLLVNFGNLFFAQEDTLTPKLADWFHHLGMGASPQATAACLKALRDTDLTADMEKITIPAFIMHASADKICPFGFAETLHKGIKNSTLIEYSKSGHGFFYEEKDKVNEDLMRLANL